MEAECEESDSDDSTDTVIASGELQSRWRERAQQLNRSPGTGAVMSDQRSSSSGLSALGTPARVRRLIKKEFRPFDDPSDLSRDQRGMSATQSDKLTTATKQGGANRANTQDRRIGTHMRPVKIEKPSVGDIPPISVKLERVSAALPDKAAVDPSILDNDIVADGQGCSGQPAACPALNQFSSALSGSDSDFDEPLSDDSSELDGFDDFLEGITRELDAGMYSDLKEEHGPRSDSPPNGTTIVVNQVVVKSEPRSPNDSAYHAIGGGESSGSPEASSVLPNVPFNDTLIFGEVDASRKPCGDIASASGDTTSQESGTIDESSRLEIVRGAIQLTTSAASTCEHLESTRPVETHLGNTERVKDVPCFAVGEGPNEGSGGLQHNNGRTREACLQCLPQDRLAGSSQTRESVQILETATKSTVSDTGLHVSPLSVNGPANSYALSSSIETLVAKDGSKSEKKSFDVAVTPVDVIYRREGPYIPVKCAANHATIQIPSLESGELGDSAEAQLGKDTIVHDHDMADQRSNVSNAVDDADDSRNSSRSAAVSYENKCRAVDAHTQTDPPKTCDVALDTPEFRSSLSAIKNGTADDGSEKQIDDYCERTFWLLQNFSQGLSEGDDSDKTRSVLESARQVIDSLNKRHGLPVSQQLNLCTTAVRSMLNALRKLSKRPVQTVTRIVREVEAKERPTEVVQPYATRCDRPANDPGPTPRNSRRCASPSSRTKLQPSQRDVEMSNGERHAPEEQKTMKGSAGHVTVAEETKKDSAWASRRLPNARKRIVEDGYGLSFLENLRDQQSVDAVFGCAIRRLTEKYRIVLENKTRLPETVRRRVPNSVRWQEIYSKRLRTELFTGFGIFLDNVADLQDEFLPLNPFCINLVPTKASDLDGLSSERGALGSSSTSEGVKLAPKSAACDGTGDTSDKARHLPGEAESGGMRNTYGGMGDTSDGVLNALSEEGNAYTGEGHAPRAEGNAPGMLKNVSGGVKNAHVRVRNLSGAAGNTTGRIRTGSGQIGNTTGRVKNGPCEDGNATGRVGNVPGAVASAPVGGTISTVDSPRITNVWEEECQQFLEKIRPTGAAPTMAVVRHRNQSAPKAPSQAAFVDVGGDRLNPALCPSFPLPSLTNPLPSCSHVPSSGDLTGRCLIPIPSSTLNSKQACSVATESTRQKVTADDSDMSISEGENNISGWTPPGKADLSHVPSATEGNPVDESRSRNAHSRRTSGSSSKSGRISTTPPRSVGSSSGRCPSSVGDRETDPQQAARKILQQGIELLDQEPVAPSPTGAAASVKRRRRDSDEGNRDAKRRSRRQSNDKYRSKARLDELTSDEVGNLHNELWEKFLRLTTRPDGSSSVSCPLCNSVHSKTSIIDHARSAHSIQKGGANHSEWSLKSSTPEMCSRVKDTDRSRRRSTSKDNFIYHGTSRRSWYQSPHEKSHQRSGRRSSSRERSRRSSHLSSEDQFRRVVRRSASRERSRKSLSPLRPRYRSASVESTACFAERTRERHRSASVESTRFPERSEQRRVYESSSDLHHNRSPSVSRGSKPWWLIRSRNFSPSRELYEHFRDYDRDPLHKHSESERSFRLHPSDESERPRSPSDRGSRSRIKGESPRRRSRSPLHRPSRPHAKGEKFSTDEKFNCDLKHSSSVNSREGNRKEGAANPQHSPSSPPDKKQVTLRADESSAEKTEKAATSNAPSEDVSARLAMLERMQKVRDLLLLSLEAKVSNDNSNTTKGESPSSKSTQAVSVPEERKQTATPQQTSIRSVQTPSVSQHSSLLNTELVRGESQSSLPDSLNSKISRLEPEKKPYRVPAAKHEESKHDIDVALPQLAQDTAKPEKYQQGEQRENSEASKENQKETVTLGQKQKGSNDVSQPQPTEEEKMKVSKERPSQMSSVHHSEPPGLKTLKSNPNLIEVQMEPVKRQSDKEGAQEETTPTKERKSEPDNKGVEAQGGNSGADYCQPSEQQSVKERNQEVESKSEQPGLNLSISNPNLIEVQRESKRQSDSKGDEKEATSAREQKTSKPENETKTGTQTTQRYGTQRANPDEDCCQPKSVKEERRDVESKSKLDQALKTVEGNSLVSKANTSDSSRKNRQNCGDSIKATANAREGIQCSAEKSEKVTREEVLQSSIEESSDIKAGPTQGRKVSEEKSGSVATANNKKGASKRRVSKPSSHIYSCSFCGAKFQSISKLRHHEEESCPYWVLPGFGRVPWRCPSCEQWIQNPKLHRRQCHTSCVSCGKLGLHICHVKCPIQRPSPWAHSPPVSQPFRPGGPRPQVEGWTEHPQGRHGCWRVSSGLVAIGPEICTVCGSRGMHSIGCPVLLRQMGYH